MPLLGQASGGFTESSSALRLLHPGVRNTVGVLTADAFTQTNPPIVTTAGTISTQTNTGVLGVLSGSVAFTRPDQGSNFIGGPVEPGAPDNILIRPLGCFINTAVGNAFENQPGGQELVSSRNGYLMMRVTTQTGAAISLDIAGLASEVANGNTASTLLGVLKMPPDSEQFEIVYDQRV